MLCTTYQHIVQQYQKALMQYMNAGSVLPMYCGATFPLHPLLILAFHSFFVLPFCYCCWVRRGSVGDEVHTYIPNTYVYSLPDPDIGNVAVTYPSSTSIAFYAIYPVTISICTAAGGALRSQCGQVDSMCAHADQAVSSGGGHLEWQIVCVWWI